VDTKFNKDRSTELYLSKFGEDYTERTEKDLELRDLHTLEETGERISTTLRRILPQDQLHSILELGCGLGHNLKILSHLVPTKNLVGVDFQKQAVNSGSRLNENINFICMPADKYLNNCMRFDLILTRMLLIHVHPSKIERLIKLISRKTRYLTCIEYYSEEYEEVPWRGQEGIVWKTNFCKLIKATIPDCEIIHQEEQKILPTKYNFDGLRNQNFTIRFPQ